MSQPEMITPDLPPRRPLPPDVRERMRHRVVGAGAVRAPLAAAAAVAVLVAGGAIVAQSTQGDTIAVAPPSTTSSATGVPGLPTVGQVVITTPGATAEDATKCGFAEADVLFTIGLPGRRILGAVGDRFCELTHTWVARNRPETVELPGGTSLLWRSHSGVLIGRAPAGTSAATAATVQSGMVLPYRISQLYDDLFVVPHGNTSLTLTFDAPTGRITEQVVAEALPHQGTWSVSREELPPGDPVVARCLDTVLIMGVEWVGDPLRWRPGALAGPADNALLVMRDQAGGTAYCTVRHDQPSGTSLGVTSPQDGALVKLRYVSGEATTATDAFVFAAGTVDAAKVGGLDVIDANGQTVSATLADGTFAVRVDGQPPLEGRNPVEGFRVRVTDHQDRVIDTLPLR